MSFIREIDGKLVVCHYSAGRVGKHKRNRQYKTWWFPTANGYGLGCCVNKVYIPFKFAGHRVRLVMEIIEE